MKPIKGKNLTFIYIFLFLIVLFSLCFYVYFAFFQETSASLVVIKQDGHIIKTLPLEKDAEFLVKSSLGENHVTIKNGSVRVTNANCPDRVCVLTSPLTRNNAATSVIVCLPHKLIISLER